MELRPLLGDNFKDNYEIFKGESNRFKSLIDEDVWFSFAEIDDEQSLTLHFLVLTFEIREKL